MCGIFATLGIDNPHSALITALKILQNRGYDSCGVAFVNTDNIMVVEKFSSIESNNSIQMLENYIASTMESLYQPQSATILHTRWATTGVPTIENAHPHTDTHKRISLVHNGIIENYRVLKHELMGKGYVFNSLTDTEVIAVLIGYYMDIGKSVEVAIRTTIERLMGTWALVIIHKDYPNKVWITRNGSPILLGMSDEYVMIASEHTAFDRYIKTYITLDNHDLVEISKDNQTINYSIDLHSYKINHRMQSSVSVFPEGYKHWMIKEIHEQPSAITHAMNNQGRILNSSMVKLGGLDYQYDRLVGLEHLIILGCGTSYNAGMWSLGIFKSLKSFNTVSVIDGAEFNASDIPLSGKTGIVLVSQSGETSDLYRCIQIATELNLITIGVINVVDSLISRESDCGVYLNAGREVAVASTKSFTNQCVILTMIAVWFSQIGGGNEEKRRKIISDLHKFQFQFANMLNSHNDQIMDIANVLVSPQTISTIFVLGKGSLHAIAMEGALKLKEVTYIHAEGYSTSALKHGALALITECVPVIIFDIGDEFREKTRICIQELSVRGAKIIRITDSDDNNTDDVNHINIYIDHNSTFGGVIANGIVQLLSYFTAIYRDIDPDFPRNLAKCVTVS